MFGKRGQHVAHGHESHVDQNLAELVAALALEFERALNVLPGQQAALDQNLAEAHVFQYSVVWMAASSAAPPACSASSSFFLWPCTVICTGIPLTSSHG